MLRCLRCKGDLGLHDNGVQCRNCATIFPVTNGVLRFVESQGYAENFGFEWGKYSRTQLDNEVSNLSERQFVESTGFSPEELQRQMDTGHRLRHGTLCRSRQPLGRERGRH